MKVSSNLVREIFTYYSTKLTDIVDEREAKQQVLMLLQHFFGIDRMRMALEPELRISESELLTIHMAVKELLTHKPIQYVLGGAYFLEHWFTVDESTLIPRPETEELVQHIANHPLGGKARTIIDFGTGSGCIAIMLKLLLQSPQVFALDVSEKALEIAKKNAEQLQADVSFFEYDILDDQSVQKLPSADLFVSNPPYVLERERTKMKTNVLGYEPASALFVPDDQALVFYQRITQLAQSRLNPGGMLWFEINEAFGGAIIQLLRQSGMTQIELLQDIHGRDRFVSCQKSE